MTQHWTDRLSDYLDGGLPAAEAGRLEAHLTRCPECAATLAQLRQVRERARSLAPPAPPHDLWPGILARIGQAEASGESRREEAGAFAPVTGIRSRRRWLDRRFSFSLPQAVAASAAIALLSAATAWWVLQREPAGGTPEPVAQAPARPALRGIASGTAPYRASGDAGAGAPLALREAAPDAGREPRQARPARREPDGYLALSTGPSYDATIAELQRVLASERGRLDTTTVRIIEQNLATVDRAVEEARRAIAADPGNPYLRSHLAATMMRKVDLLRRATVIASGQG
jgi:anti-sigma factor RsiW